MLQDDPIRKQTIPWTTRDVWYGVFFITLLLAVAIAFILWRKKEFQIDPGVAIILIEPLFLLPVWIWALRKYRVGWEALGFRHFQGKVIGLGCGLIILIYAFNIVYGVLLTQFHFKTQADSIMQLTKLTSFGVLWIGGVFIAPFVEEIFFRGFVFAGLRQSYGWKKAALVSSIIFTIAHIQWTAFPPLFVIGFILAYLYEKSESIWPAIIMHVTINGLSIGAIYLVKLTQN